MIFVGTKNLLRKVPIDKVKEFENIYLLALEKRFPEVLNKLKQPKAKITADLAKVLTDLAAEISTQYQA